MSANRPRPKVESRVTHKWNARVSEVVEVFMILQKVVKTGDKITNRDVKVLRQGKFNGISIFKESVEACTVLSIVSELEVLGLCDKREQFEPVTIYAFRYLNTKQCEHV